VLSPTAALERSTKGALAVRVTAGEDARARVCVTPAPSAPERCRGAALTGHRPLALELAGRTSAGANADVAVELVAAANRARRTMLYLRAR
jgi:hypothetical protein